jgi:hypothetical protein
MPKGPRKSGAKQDTAATVGYEAQLWQMADALRGSMDAAEYKHVVLGLTFLKYISDAFEEQHAKLEVKKATGADPEDPDEYRAQNVFWVPPEARWTHLRARAKRSTNRAPCGRRHGRHRARQPGAQGGAVQGVRLSRARQDAPQPGHAGGNGNGGKARADIWIYGQESNYTTWRVSPSASSGKPCGWERTAGFNRSAGGDSNA